MLSIGADIVFSKDAPSFRSLLEDKSITKITFDCRSDSDALFHQFGVTLSGVLELQVLDQAIRIEQGELPPSKCPYLRADSTPFLQGIKSVSQRYSIQASKTDCPHKFDPTAWAKRPLAPSDISYAGNDILVIRLLAEKMRQIKLSTKLKADVQVHSKRYEGMYRDLAVEVERNRGGSNVFVMEEHGILDPSELPANHPRRTPTSFVGGIKWDKAVLALQDHGSQPLSLFDNVLFILQHDDWYTEAGYDYLRQLVSEYPYFTSKQRSRLASPPKLQREEEYDDYCYDDSEYYSLC